MTLIKRPRAGSQWVDVPATQLLLQLLNKLYVRIFIQKQLRGLFVSSEGLWDHTLWGSIYKLFTLIFSRTYMKLSIEMIKCNLINFSFLSFCCS